MAQNAELLLKVGLDLSHFRQQLTAIGSQLAGQPLSINVKFDRQKIVSEFRLLDRYIRNKKFYVEVNTNLKTEVDRADKLVQKLNEIKRTASSIDGASTQAARATMAGSVATASYKDLQALYKFAKEAKIPFEQLTRGAASSAAELKRVLAPAFANVAEDIKKGIVVGLADANSALAQIGKSMSEALLNAITTSLGIASPSKETGKLGKFAAQGFEQGFISGIVKAERSMARAIRSALMGAIREGFGNLPGMSSALVSFERQLAASVQLAVRKAVRQGLVSAITPGTKGGLLGGTGGAITGATVGGAKALGTGVAGGVAKLTAGGLIGTAANLARYSIDSGAYQEFVGKLYQEIIHAALSTGSQGAIIGALAVGGVAGGLGFARGASGSLILQAVTAIRNRILAALLAVSTGELNYTIKVMVRDVTGLVFQGAIRQLRAATAQTSAIDVPAQLLSRAPVIGPSGTGRLLAGTARTPIPEPAGARAPAGLLPSATRQGNLAANLEVLMQALSTQSRGAIEPTGARAPAGLLPSATRQSNLTAGLEALMQALSAQSRGAVEPAGAIVSMESGFIVAMRDRFARAAERYLFGIETQVVDLYDAVIRQVEVAIDKYMARIQAQIYQRERQAFSVTDLGAVAQRLLPGAPTARAPLMLPPAGGTTAATRVRISGGDFTGQGYVPPGGLPADTFRMGGRQGPATFIGAGSQMEKFKTILDVAGTSMKNFRASQVPLLGGLREIGGEFAMATKQVLLYGTAYRALAFITALPGQILNAAKSQQQYNNALQTATQDTGTFAKELLYVDNVQRAFGLNLDTTRTGFTRLYASMAPAGFDSGSIEKLFTGISAATASLQLTPDKAERVIYAFGQMASKGQIMSEELKGQLGDVLPGALAIFSKAAGMSVKEFGKAMEDGVFVGGKFREVFAKVSDELMTRFGTGAQAAGKSLQGLLNTVQGDFQRTLESFSPLANMAAQSILGPLSGALKQLSMAAQVAMGEQERVTRQLADAKASGADAQSIAALEARLRGLQEAAKDPAIAQQAKNIQTFVTEISKAGTAVMNVANAIGNVLNPFLTFLGTNLSTVATLLISLSVGFAATRLAIAAAMATLTLFNVIVKAVAGGAVGVNALSAAFRVLGVSAGAANIGVVGLSGSMKVLLYSSGLGIAVGLLTAIGAAAMGMGNAMQQAAQEARQAMQDMAQAAIVGNTALIQMRAATYKANIATLNQMQTEILKGGGRAVSSGRATTRTVFDISPVQKQLLQAVPGVVLPQGPVTEQQVKKAVNNAKYIQQTGLQAATKFTQISKANESKLGLNKPQPKPMAPEPVDGKTKSAKDKGADDAKRLAEEIARQAAAASDALFAEQQRLLVLQQTNPTAKAIVEYTNQELAIQRELNKSLKEAKGEKEKVDLKEVARLKSSSNLLELQNSLNDTGKEGLQRLEDAIKTQKEELFVNGEIEKLLREKVSPERAKQIADTRLLVNKQLESLDLSIGQAEAAVEEAKARGASVAAIEDAIAALKQRRSEIVGKGAQLEAGIPMEGGPKTARDYLMESADEARKNLEQLTNQGYQLAQVANSIGDAFGNAFKGLITGSMTAQEALAGFFSSVADHFADMVAKMIAEWLKAQLIQGFMNFISAIIPGAGVLGSAAAGLSGTGALASGGIKGFSGGSMAGLPTSYGASTGGLGSITGGGGFGNWTGPRFANGGIVAGPTLGLVGEGRYNEAIVPLPNGRSIPVELGGGMGGVNVVVNVDATGSEAAGNEGQAKALGNAISAAVQSEIIKQKRPGGLLAR